VNLALAADRFIEDVSAGYYRRHVSHGEDAAYPAPIFVSRPAAGAGYIMIEALDVAADEAR